MGHISSLWDLRGLLTEDVRSLEHDGLDFFHDREQDGPERAGAVHAAHGDEPAADYGFLEDAVEIQGAEAKILAVNDAVTEDNRIDQRNRRFGPMLMSLIVATYVVAGDLMLLHENMSIGQFLTNMEVFRRVCDA